MSDLPTSWRTPRVLSVPRTVYPYAEDRISTAPPLMSTAWISFVRAENERNNLKLRDWASVRGPSLSQKASPRAQLAPLGVIPSPRQKMMATWKPTTLSPRTPVSRYPPFMLPQPGVAAQEPAPVPAVVKPAAPPEVARGVSQYIPPAELAQTGLDDATNDVQSRFKSQVEKYYLTLRKAFLTIDKDRSGSLTIDEIRNELQKFQIYQENPASSEQMLDNLFARCDVDGNGKIDYKEFAAHLAHSQVQDSQVFGTGDKEQGMKHHIKVESYRPGQGGRVFINENRSRGRFA